MENIYSTLAHFPFFFDVVCTQVQCLPINHLSISELQEHGSSHCSLLWHTKSIVYQQNYYKIGAESLNSTCLQSFVHVYIQVIELQELARCIVMYGPKFFVVFQKRRCLHKCYYAYFLRVTKLYHLTKFQMLVYTG